MYATDCSGNWLWRVRVHAPTSIRDDGSPSSMADLAISPSPARDAVVVSYSLARAGVVSLQLYDITGARVATIASGRQSAGAHSVLFRNQNSAFRIARGVYLLKFQTETRRAVRKLLLN